MKFTFWAFLLPCILVIVSQVIEGGPHPVGPRGPIAAALAIWILAGTPATLLYWLVRLVRYAWRGERAASSPAPESDRIFGRLD